VERQKTAVEDIIVTPSPILDPRQKIMSEHGIVHIKEYGGSVAFDLDKSILLLKRKAHQIGADAVVSFQLIISSQKGAILYLYGTPVLLPWPAGHAAPDTGLDPDLGTYL